MHIAILCVLSYSGLFGIAVLQTPPRDDALALLLTFGSANTWCQDFRLTSTAPCLAHTLRFSGGPRPQGPGHLLEPLVGQRTASRTKNPVVDPE